MFNLLIHNDKDIWKSSPMDFERARVSIEYTANEISERYKNFTKKAIKELKSFPTLFVVEREEGKSKLGYIIDIKLHENSIVVHFEIDSSLPKLAKGTIKEIKDEIDLGDWELYRTHWAIKDADLFKTLIDKNYITKKEYLSSKYAKRMIKNAKNKRPKTGKGFNKSQIFIVHGHDELVKLDMESFISDLGLEPIILHKQASGGRSIIDKIAYYSNVGFGIVLYTPCDIGAKRDTIDYSYRARQNVVFEHGYLMAKLGHDKVAAIVKDDVEKPNDISGLVYINFDENEAWKKELITELKNAGYL